MSELSGGQLGTPPEIIGAQDQGRDVLRKRVLHAFVISQETKLAFEEKGVSTKIVKAVRKLLKEEFVEDVLSYVLKVEADSDRSRLVDGLGKSMNLGMQDALKPYKSVEGLVKKWREKYSEEELRDLMAGYLRGYFAAAIMTGNPEAVNALVKLGELEEGLTPEEVIQKI